MAVLDKLYLDISEYQYESYVGKLTVPYKDLNRGDMETSACLDRYFERYSSRNIAWISEIRERIVIGFLCSYVRMSSKRFPSK